MEVGWLSECGNPFKKEETPSNEVRLFSQLVEAYILHRIRTDSRTPERAEYDVRLYAKTHLADLQDKRLDQLKVEDFLKVKRQAGKNSVAANRAIQLCRRILRWSGKRAEKDALFVFPGIGKTQHVMDLKGSWGELRKRAQIPDLTVHDLRRSHGSYLAVSGASLQIIGQALGHRSTASTQIYLQLLSQSVPEAQAKSERKMRELIASAAKRERKSKPLTANKAGKGVDLASDNETKGGNVKLRVSQPVH